LAAEPARRGGAGRRDPARLRRTIRLTGRFTSPQIGVRGRRGDRPAGPTGAAAASAAAPRLLLLPALRALPARRGLHRPGAPAAAEPRHVRPRARLRRAAAGSRGEVPRRGGADGLRRRGTQAAADDRRAARLPRAREGARAMAAVTFAT